MAKIYAKRIRENIMTIDEVPERWKIETQTILDREEI